MTEFMGRKLTNPLIASSCIATESVENVSKLVKVGIEGVILKSCANYTPAKTTGKRCFAYDEATGYTYVSSPFELEILTLDKELEMIRELRSRYNILIIPSFTATTLDVDAWLPSCKELEKVGADAIQLDFFYMGNLLGEHDFCSAFVHLLKSLRSALTIPIMPKLNVNLPKDFIIPLIKKAGIEYVSLLDSVRSPYIQLKDGNAGLNPRLDPLTTSCFGGWQLPLIIGYTYTAAQHGLKVCAGGGITCKDDAKRLFAAGAVTVQSATELTKRI